MRSKRYGFAHLVQPGLPDPSTRNIRSSTPTESAKSERLFVSSKMPTDRSITQTSLAELIVVTGDPALRYRPRFDRPHLLGHAYRANGDSQGSFAAPGGCQLQVLPRSGSRDATRDPSR